MAAQEVGYVIVGGGMAGVSAIQGVREIDLDGTLLLIGAERHMPYNRPPLSKDLWFDRTTIEGIMAERGEFWGMDQVRLDLGAPVIQLDPARRTVDDRRGNRYRYRKLLLATGGTPRRLRIPGGELAGVVYYRTLDDYLRLRHEARHGRSVLLIGGGFIGSELAAALHAHGVAVTMLFPGGVLARHVLPEALAARLTERYRGRGIRILAHDAPTAIEPRGAAGLLTHTRRGRTLASDLVVVGIGLTPEVALARDAGLTVGNGILVDDKLRTSDPHIYAAGDNALYVDAVLGERRRVDHWDNAVNQGVLAGRNMAGADEVYRHLPSFSSELLDFGYEAVGDVDTALETVTDWEEPNEQGVVFYLRDDRVRGVLLCNLPGRLDAARELIRRSAPVGREALHGMIRP
jgi:NADPH-dependent 2,4-dienoyl-CoA reductase/sulfur reductase-like enzyme